MPKYFNLSDYDVIFLSYDEPNADENWQILLKKIPWALRVNGITGSDTAHKECAKLGKTERIIIIDGDNRLDEDFLNQGLELDDSVDTEVTVFSWPAKNSINGLMYGNGGIKCWHRNTIFSLKTHENCVDPSSKSRIDFCWDLNYMSIDQCYSTTMINQSKLQAWRAGFREGVKLSLNNGNKITDLNLLDENNLNRLKIWMSVGSDVSYGIWAILGARQGCYLTHFGNFDTNNVRNFQWLNDFYMSNVDKLNEAAAKKQIQDLGDKISTQVPIFLISKDISCFFKGFNFNQKRQSNLLRNFKNHRYDIVMITYDEPQADFNYQNLLRKFPHTKRIHGVKGIHQAHIEAAKIVSTEMFWVVDGDAEISDNFNFSYYDDPDDTVRVWRCKNPINDLIYGYGGVKLLPRQKTLEMSLSKPDMTTSISNSYKPIQEISNITNFNVSEFHTWRSAFRECCKLSSRLIDRQKDRDTIQRLKTWCSIGKDRKFGKFAIAGAKAGKAYGEKNKNNLTALKKINNFDWLKKEFNKIKNDI